MNKQQKKYGIKWTKKQVKILKKIFNLDIFVNGSGTGGTIGGISKYLKEKNDSIKVILSDPPGSALFNRINCGVLYTD